MATTIIENRFVVSTDWAGYERFLNAVGDLRVRLTYDRGVLELMTPSGRHEREKSILGRFAETMMTELGVDFEFGGAVTMRKRQADRGLEPDECYWIEGWKEAGTIDTWDASHHPPPDLAIEVEISSSILDRLGIYAALGMPEIWRLRQSGRLDF
ncbi:MAG: Uma2 family endonuclease, partial [Candidatus Eremiobacterota bacterium]